MFWFKSWISLKSFRSEMAVNKRFIFILALALAIQAFGQRKNFVMRTIDWSYKIVQGDSAKPYKKYFFPVPIVSYKPETRWQLGLSLSHFFRAKQNDSTTRPSVIRLNTTYTQNNQFSIRPMFDVFTKENKYSLRGVFQYTDFAENYWGIGQQTTDATKELYSFKEYKANIKATRLLKKGIYAGVQVYYDNIGKIGYATPTSAMKNSGITGTKGYEALGLGAIVTYDTRDNIYFPTQGYFVDMSFLSFDKNIASTSSFTSTLIDARTYYKLWAENVLAFQLYANFNEGDVPYRLMGTLGSDGYFRGYYYGRFRDKHALTMQTEMRKQIWGPVAITAFIGAGNVANTINELSMHVKPMYGLGLRIKAIPREKINMRFDAAFGQGKIQAFYITLNEAF